MSRRSVRAGHIHIHDDAQSAEEHSMSLLPEERTLPPPGFALAFRRLRDPLLLLCLPATFAVLTLVTGYASVGLVGFDFRGTLWEPAHALLEGSAIYPEPTRAAVAVGNPAVYPPPLILLASPLTLVPASAAAWLWGAFLVACVGSALWIVGVRDWRCYAVALSWPAVLHGLLWGNVSVALLLPVAVAWRYRQHALVVGGAVGFGIAAKLFLWPLLIWLALTRRFRAAAIALLSSVALVLGSWALIGFEGFRQYPDLLRATQDFYAERSLSFAGLAAMLGAPSVVVSAAPAVAGIVLIALAVYVVRFADGDRRAFAALVGACIVASPIVWPNYLALLIVPIAATWPRLAPAWLAGYALWLVGLLPKPVAAETPCCRPDDLPEFVWVSIHANVPSAWPAAGTMLTALVLIGIPMVTVRWVRRDKTSIKGT
jgi:hypothetical protein